MNKLVYISGPYSAPSKLEIEANINVAREAAVWCAKHEVFYFCPHLNTAFFDQWAPEIPVEFYYDMDLHISWMCDGLFLLKGWKISLGSQREYNLFRAARKPMFRYPEQQEMLLSWYREEQA